MTHTQFIQKLYHLAGRHYRLHLLGRIVSWLLIFLFSGLGMSLLDSMVHFSRISRWGFFTLQVLLMAFLFIEMIWPAVRKNYRFRKSGELSAFARLSDRLTENKDIWVNTAELIEQYQAGGDNNPFQEAAINRLIPQCDFSALKRALPLKKYLPAYSLPVVLLLSSLLLYGLIGPSLGISALRMLMPWGMFAAVPAYSFEVAPGSVTAYTGDDLKITAGYRGPRAGGMLLWKEEGARRMSYPLVRAGVASYTLTLKNIKKDFRYWLSATEMETGDYKGHIVSDTFRVVVLDPPMVKTAQIKAFPPAYSGLPGSSFDLSDTRYSLLPGTEIQFKLTANKALRAAALQFSDSTILNLDVHNFTAEGRAVFTRSRQYRFNLLSMDSLTNRQAVLFHVDMLEDRPPYVEIVLPGTDVEAQPEDILALEAAAGDDFGVSALTLRYRHLAAGDTGVWRKRPFQLLRENGETRGRLLFDFSDLAIAFGDEIEYYAVARDGNVITGPGKAESARYKVIFPSLDDLFRDFTEKTRDQNEKMEDISGQSEELKKTLEEIQRDLKRSQKMDWETKKRIEQTLEEQKKLREKVQKIEQELQEMVERLENKDMISEELMQKYQQLQEMFRQIAPPELMEAMRKLQQAMEKSDPAEVQKALQSFKENQENFKQNLERTLELFKQIQMEQQLQRLADQARELLEKQKQITEELNKNSDDAGRMQEQQTGQLKRLEASLKEMMDNPRMQSFKEAMRQMEEARKNMSRNQLARQSEEIRQKIEQGQQEQAGEQSQALQKDMAAMQSQLQSSLNSMQQRHKQKVESRMLAITGDLLKLSFEQERLQRRSRSASQVDDELRDIARKQARVQQNLQKTIGEMIELSKQTFFMEQSLNRNMAMAQSQMRKSLDDLSERRAMPAAQSQRKAMEALNRSVQGMQRSLSRMEKSSSGTGFEQLMEQLKQMAGMQGGLNGETMGLFNAQQGNRGRLTPDQQGRQRRLAAQQQALKQAMEELAGEMGNRGDVLGRLGELSEEMDKVVQDLLKKGVSRKTVERQQRILSRMLDAQKSAREREYSKKRRAERAKKYQAVDPRRLTPAENAYLKQLQEALQKSYNEGYAPEYQQMIEAYIHKLINEKQQRRAGDGRTR